MRRLRCYSAYLLPRGGQVGSSITAVRVVHGELAMGLATTMIARYGAGMPEISDVGRHPLHATRTHWQANRNRRQ
jgi:hypothetical protein